MTQTFEPGRLDMGQMRAFFAGGRAPGVDARARAGVDRAAAVIADIARGDVPVYGVNTGFGKLASMRIAPGDTARLQRNLILSHCAGVGDPLPRAETALMMLLKVNSLARGASGVRWELIALLEAMLAHDIWPNVPEQGSVGASGDLAPLAHMAAVMIGEGQAWGARVDGHPVSGGEALGSAGLDPIVLGPKEGLALINGTQFSTAVALGALFDLWHLVESQIAVAALSTDAIMGSTAPLRPEIHALRGHRGQIEVAAAMRGLLDGSEIRESHREGDTRVQDPYCIRCQAQVAGAALDQLRMAAHTLAIEANAVTDNPLVFEDASVISGGNFHAEPVAMAADQIAIAIAELGAIAQRRIALMVDPTLSFDLPPFLTPEPGLNSGLMIAEVTSAALMSENKHLANPCSTDSTPTSANQEDHVSMAAHGALRLRRMVDNLAHIVGIELLCAAQGVEFRAPLQTSAPLRELVKRLRTTVPSLGEDRMVSADIGRAATLCATGLDLCTLEMGESASL
ncbi:histidine ammonia-lyase [Oceaniradius stylonematis]|uniref:histidine ammonia-lyase n=1 Tax=Oceaniradius stylonematis TaxID=2184161 RepID=UPI0035CECD0E